MTVIIMRGVTRPMRIGLWHGCLHFRDRDHWQISAEQKEERSKQSKRAQHGSHVNPCWREKVPTGGKKIIRKAGDNNHEALEPHSNVHHKTQRKHDWNAGADALEPEQLRRDHVATDHDPIGPPVLSERAVDEREALIHCAGIPRNEELHGVGVPHHASRDQDNFVHVVQVAQRDEILQAEKLARRNRKRDHHRKTAEDGARDKVRREDGGVPTRNLADCEIETHHGVNA